MKVNIEMTTQQVDKKAKNITKMNENTKLIVCAVGIFVCYFYFGILQEKITRSRYGDSVNADGSRGEKFTYTLALVFVQCFCNWIFAKGMLLAKPQKKDSTHPAFYASSALTYLLAMVSSNMALRWVAYPTQVVAKSAKPIPVMLLGVLIGRKSYSMQKYLFIFLIVVGVVLFMYNDKKGSSAQDNMGLGELLLFLSLSMDGLTGAIQERMRSSSAPSAQHMMLAMNWWSSMMSGLGLVVTGEGREFVGFASKYPHLLSNLALLALAGALGQLFIFIMVEIYGALACSVVTTTRKFFTVLCSVLLFGNNLSSRQWLGTVLVFTGLFADQLIGKKKKSPSGNIDNEKKPLKQ